MKKLLLMLLISLGSQVLFAQAFSIVIPDTVKSGVFNVDIVFDVEITNITNSPQSVYMVRKSNHLPENWTSSLCFDVCFAPFLDSVNTTAAFNSSPLSAGEKRIMSLHVTPSVTQGTGNVQLVVGNLSSPSEKKIINFTANSSVTSIKGSASPVEYFIAQNYPNPFNPSTVINYSVGKAGQVTLKLFNVIGKEIAVLVNEFKEPGNYYYNFNAKDLTAGVYLYKFSSGNFVSVKKMILMK
jgi:hypothetical protein